jgi:hypothetical protein
MKSVGVLLALAFTAMPVAGFATETGTMICKGGIVSIGDTAGEVTGKCGPPAATTQREQAVVGSSKGIKVVTTTTVNDWFFNFGPNQFQYQLALENGRVAKIESLGYGY